MHLLSLPAVMLEHIFSFLTYDQIAKIRTVCKDFDIISQRCLNRGFQMIEKRITANLKAIKGQLPRRESERRFHRLSRHCDILTSVETRLSMLKMTYNGFIEQGKCCFIPGKILDELHHVMRTVDESDPLPMAFEVLQELRDISGMAIEHFEEVVSPTLRQRVDDYSRMAPMPVMHNDMDKKGPKSAAGATLKMVLLRETCLRNNKNIIKIEKKFQHLSRKLELYKRLMTISKRQLIQKQIEQSYKIVELKRKVEEYEVKFKELSLSTGYKNYLKDVESGKSSAAASNHNLSFKMRLKNFGSQIKLDPSLNIGSNRGRRGSPIIKPRRASLLPPGHKFPGDYATGSSMKTGDFSNTLISNLVTRKQSDLETDERLKNVSKNSKLIKKRIDDKKNYQENRLSVIRQLNQALQDPLDNIKLTKKKDKYKGQANRPDNLADPKSPVFSKNPWLYSLVNMESAKMIEEGFPMPSTSKGSVSDLSDNIGNNYIGVKDRKRRQSDEYEQNASASDDNSTSKGFQAKVQLLSRTIMKLIESLSDATEAKKRRVGNE